MTKPSDAARAIRLLAKADREAQVEDAYMALLGIAELERPYGCDGIGRGILFEFKFDERLEGVAGFRAIAQAACYVRRLVADGVYRDRIHAPPATVAVCDRNQAICFPASRLAALVGDDSFDWPRPASSPDPRLVAAVAAAFADAAVHDMTTEAGVLAFADAAAAGESVKQRITGGNFDRIFGEWRRHFAPDKTPQEAALAFLLDLQMQGVKDEASGRVILRCESAGGGDTKYFDIRVPVARYDSFWATYERPPSNDEMARIVERKDRLVVMQLRRTTGEFFTPLAYASLAHAYLARTIEDRSAGGGAHHSMYDDFNWWDPACGTGNLTLDCPPSMKGALFMSTLNQEDVDVIKSSGQNPNAEVFAFDFLNLGDADLPDSLKAALKNGKPWIFLLNPPYARGTGGNGLKDEEKVRAGMADTAVGSRMAKAKLGAGCQNLMSQFAFRISEIVNGYGLVARIGLFSKGLLWTGSGLGPFRDMFYSTFDPLGGFCFHCSEFQGASGAWPVVFTTWGMFGTGAPTRNVEVDVLDGPDTVVGRKVFKPARNPLSKWVPRPKGTVLRPPMNGALGVADKQGVRKDTAPPDALGYLRQTANDVQNSGSGVFLLPSPDVNGYGWSITPGNFHDSMVCFAARKLVKPTWLNDRDEFSVPDTSHPAYARFALDAVVWSLFHGSNQTSSLGNAVYKGVAYDIPNHFFWMTPAEMMAVDGLPRPLWQQCRTAVPRFASGWLAEHAPALSPDAAELVSLAKGLVAASAPFRPSALPKFQLDRWDAGWYQIRMGLYGGTAVPFQQPPEMLDLMARFKQAHKSLGDRLRPMIYTLGMLPD